MVIKVCDGSRVWNARVIKNSVLSPLRYKYMFTSRDVGDRWDEAEYKVYRDTEEGCFVAVKASVI